MNASPLNLKAFSDRITSTYRDNHLLRNSGWVIAGTGINGILGLVFWATATNRFTPTSIGGATAVISAMTFASTLAMMGLGTTAVQVMPQADDETWSSALNSLLFGGLVVGSAAGVITALLLPHISNLGFVGGVGPAICISVGVAALTVATLLDYVFTADRSTHNIVIRGASFGCLKLALLSIIILFGVRSPTWLIVAWVAGSIITTVVTLLWQLPRLEHNHQYRLRGVYTYVRNWIRTLLLHHVTALGGVLIPSLMPVLVVARLSKADSAYFYVAWLIASILLTVSSSVSGNLLADMSYADGSMEVKLKKAAKIIALLLLPPTIVLVIFGRQILELFGVSYAAKSYTLLLMFVIVAIPDAVTNVYVTVLRVRGLPERAAAMNIVMAAVALAGAWWLMGSFGVFGAAWAWALSQTVGCLYVVSDALLQRGRNQRTRPGSSGGVALAEALGERHESG